MKTEDCIDLINKVMDAQTTDEGRVVLALGKATLNAQFEIARQLSISNQTMIENRALMARLANQLEKLLILHYGRITVKEGETTLHLNEAEAKTVRDGLGSR